MPHCREGYTGIHYSEAECALMELQDKDILDCECHYASPYGFVVMAGCERHDG